MGTRAYLIGQGYLNLKKHGGKTFSTMLIICATMFILALFLIVYVNIETNAKVITENQGLKAFISDDINEADVASIGEKIKEISNVKNITYLDKAAALEDAKATLKEYAYLLEGYESSNPFPRSFIVVFENLESTEQVKEAVESVDGIYKVSYNDTIINAVIKISDVGNIVIIAVGAAMFLISIFIISNTIKLAVYSNKREIYIMKYIGATSKFIRYPFVVSGVLMGLGSAMFSWIIASLGYVLLYSKMPQMNSDIGAFGLVSYTSFWYIVLLACVVMGVLLGGIGSSIAIKKYLKDFKPNKVVLKEQKNKIKEEKIKQKEKIKKEEAALARAEYDRAWMTNLEQTHDEEPVQESQIEDSILKENKEKKAVKPLFKKQMSELEEAKELRRAGRRNAKKK